MLWILILGSKSLIHIVWLEDDLSNETGDWVKAQNEVTAGYLYTNDEAFRRDVAGGIDGLVN